MKGPAKTGPNWRLVFGKKLTLSGEKDFVMRKKFSVEQIVGVLKQAKVGVPVAELIWKVGITEQTSYHWEAKYGGLEVDQVRQIKQLPT
jgi:Transposase